MILSGVILAQTLPEAHTIQRPVFNEEPAEPV
jgi:hypothetical protein